MQLLTEGGPTPNRISLKDLIERVSSAKALGMTMNGSSYGEIVYPLGDPG